MSEVHELWKKKQNPNLAQTVSVQMLPGVFFDKNMAKKNRNNQF